ncbi:MAG: DUF2141 domain-containing protein [Saprospiraceae bacterium]
MPTLLLVIYSLLFPSSTVRNLELTINNVVPQKGNVMVAVHNRNNFLKTRIVEKSLPAAANSLRLSFDLPEGEYAIAVYQDGNRNQQLDTNMFGVPTEAYGFSNNIRPKFRAPSFDEAKFTLNSSSKNLSITLEKW